MKLVILESPYAGDIEANVAYARECVRDSLARGEAPIASHLLYTQPGILRDEEPSERAWGIAAGLAWRKVAECSVFYTDRGWSSGMLAALHQALNVGADFELRALNGEPQIPATLCEDMEAVIRSAVSSETSRGAE